MKGELGKIYGAKVIKHYHYTIKSTNPSSRATFLNVELFRVYRHMMYGMVSRKEGERLMKLVRDSDKLLGDVHGDDYWRKM